MALWTFTEMSQNLGCSIQNISNRKNSLRNMGFLEIDVDGKEKINENGYNYLMNKRKNTMKRELNKFNDNLVNTEEKTSNNNDSNAKQFNLTNDFIVEFLKNEVEELKGRVIEEQQQKKYWQDLYIKQNEEFKKLAFPPMLDTEEGNRETEEREKKGHWWHFWKQ